MNSNSKKTKQNTYIVKIRGGCNLNCSYCYYHNSFKQNQMEEISLDLIYSFLNQLSDYSTHNEIVWHGGEPLLGTKKLFKKILLLEKKLEKDKGIHFHNNIQTNGTLIDNDWINLFLEGDFRIGISIDGPKQIHDLYRLTRKGNGSFNDTMRGIDLLKKNNINFGCLSVITKSSLNKYKEILDFFISNELYRIDFLPYVEKDIFNNLMSDSLNPLDFSDFLIKIFNYSVERNVPEIKIRFISEIIKGLIGQRPSLCKFNNGCTHVIVINYDGIVSGCDKFPGMKINEFGNLYHNKLSDILSSKNRDLFISQIKQKHQECSECKYLYLCNGGCRKYSFMWNMRFDEKNYFCKDRKALFAYFSKYFGLQDFQQPDSLFQFQEKYLRIENNKNQALVDNYSEDYSDSWSDHWSDHRW